MHRPLRVPFRQRVWQLLRGLVFYNTVYWKKASDGLKMPSLSAEERERQRPVRDLEVIRPRENPRAKLAGGEEARVRRSKGKEVRLGALARQAEEAAAAEAGGPAPPGGEAGAEGETYVKRRRYRRRFFGGA